MDVELLARLKAEREAWDLSRRRYMVPYIEAYTSEDFCALIGGLEQSIIASAAIVVIGDSVSTVAGTAIGAIAGGLVTGGPGALPGAAVGAEVGFEVGNMVVMYVLEAMGIAFIAEFVLGQVSEAGVHFYKGLRAGWRAGGWTLTSRVRGPIINYAAQELGMGVGVLFALILMGLAAYMGKEGFERISNCRFFKGIGDRLVVYLHENMKWIDDRFKGGPRPNRTIVVQNPAARAPFEDMPPFRYKGVDALREWLKAHDFRKYVSANKLRGNQSEIWIRDDNWSLNRSGECEAVRIDPEGHPDPENKFHDGEGGRFNENMEWEHTGAGREAHFHKAVIPLNGREDFCFSNLMTVKGLEVQYTDGGVPISSSLSMTERIRLAHIPVYNF